MGAYLYDPDSLKQAVVRNGADQFYQFGIALGLTHGQIGTTVNTIEGGEGKLLAIINRRKAAVDDAKLQKELIVACKNVASPIWGDVERDLTAQGSLHCINHTWWLGLVLILC